MNNQILHLPLFPIPTFLLPGGVIRLRIFEQRYLKLVTIAAKGQGFVLMINSKSAEHHEEKSEVKNRVNDNKWGSWVEVVNFHQGKDGVLEIDVKCSAMVKILSLTQDKDELSFGDVELLSHWSEHAIESNTSKLYQSLKKLICEDKMLNTLYAMPTENSANWVVARWLELLPIALNLKTRFIEQHSFEEAKNLVHSIIFSEK